MARPLRVEYEGAIYHVMSRGDRQEAIFLDDEDRRRFLGTLGETCQRASWQVHAYCLMGNHFHLVLETPMPSLVAGMKWFLGTTTQRFNARHRMRGHLFSGRYKALLVDGSDDFYLRVVCNYVHLNPWRAGLIAEGQTLGDYAWSSYPQYLQAPAKRPPWLRVDRVFGELGIRRDNARGRAEFRDFMESRVRQDDKDEEELWKGIRRGWKLGAEDFLERLMDMGVMENADRGNLGGEAVGETMEARARRLIKEHLALKRMGLGELQARAKGDAGKTALAAKLRKETTMTMGWIARELNAGTAQTLWGALRKWREKGDNTRD